jgi:NAD(P)-dependent dehydrogenase (short-subunit alcohol dehydrogenase family)
VDVHALFDLTGKTAVITGGASGIGYAIAEGLASAGATVTIAARSADKIEQAAERIRAQGWKAHAHPVDVANRPSVEALVADTLAACGRIDILVNSAAVIQRMPIEEATDEQWDAMINTNLRGVFLCCQVVGREMLKRKAGKIVNLSSNISQVLQALRGVYAVSKAGVSHLTRVLALEWAPHGINVNAIAPAPTITELNQRFFEEHPIDFKARVASIPMGRMGSPQDYVGAALFLASKASDFVTGQTYFVDGGSNLI